MKSLFHSQLVRTEVYKSPPPKKKLKLMIYQQCCKFFNTIQTWSVHVVSTIWLARFICTTNHSGNGFKDPGGALRNSPPPGGGGSRLLKLITIVIYDGNPWSSPVREHLHLFQLISRLSTHIDHQGRIL